MRSGPGAAVWMGGAFCAALLLAAGALLALGPGERGTDVALLATARLAFLLFWPAYAGAALASLFGRRLEPVRRRGRELGLAFASALVVHLGLVAWLSLALTPPGARTFLVFGVAALCTLLLALSSRSRLRQAVPPPCWRALRPVAMNYVAFAFALDFLRNPFSGGARHIVGYAPFATLALCGAALRLAAYGIARRMRAAALRSTDGRGAAAAEGGSEARLSSKRASARA